MMATALSLGRPATQTGQFCLGSAAARRQLWETASNSKGCDELPAAIVESNISSSARVLAIDNRFA